MIINPHQPSPDIIPGLACGTTTYWKVGWVSPGVYFVRTIPFLVSRTETLRQQTIDSAREACYMLETHQATGERYFHWRELARGDEIVVAAVDSTVTAVDGR